MKYLDFTKWRITPTAVSTFRIFRFWPSLVLAAVLLGFGANAHAQTNVSFNTNLSYASDYGYSSRTYSMPLGSYSAGTTLDVTWTITNNTGYPVILLPTSASANKIALVPAANMSLLSETVPGADLIDAYNAPGNTNPIDPAKLGPVTVQSGQALTITFQVQVTSSVTNATASIGLSVGGVYDQVWNYGDFDSICGYLISSTAVVVNASNPQESGDATGAQPGCAYMQEATFHNNLSYPVTVYYTGYSDSGTIAPYISGTLCNLSPPCVGGWVDGITLQPGESSAPFTMLVGMPWFISNEARQTTGSYLFTWHVTASLSVKDDSATTAPNTPVTIDVLANDTLVEGVSYTITLSNTTHGTWVVNGNNTVTFTPDSGFTGEATAQYTVTDPDDQSASATITVTVRDEILPPPTATPMLNDAALALLVLALGALGWSVLRERLR